MTICFDIDGVLCTQVDGHYDDAQPNPPMIDLLNRLHGRGCRIVLHTSRFMGSAGNDPAKAEMLGREYTEHQLKRWGVRYHELRMGKPRYDYVIDDRSVFYQNDAHRIEAILQTAQEQKSNDAG